MSNGIDLATNNVILSLHYDASGKADINPTGSKEMTSVLLKYQPTEENMIDMYTNSYNYRQYQMIIRQLRHKTLRPPPITTKIQIMVILELLLYQPKQETLSVADD